MKVNLKNKFLEELTKVPIVQVACEKVGISRQTFYRWKSSSKTFSASVEKAMDDGVSIVNDMSETQLMNMIKNGEFKAISFWLRHRNAKYREKVEVTHKSESLPLSDAQKQIINTTINLIKNDDNN